MGLFGKAAKTVEVQKPEVPVITLDSVYHGPGYLVELVKKIRPRYAGNFEEAELNFKALFCRLQNDKAALFSLKKAMLLQFLKTGFVPALTESGMVSSRGFLQEFIKKVKYRYCRRYWSML